MGFWSWLKRAIQEDNARAAERRAKDDVLRENARNEFVLSNARRKGAIAAEEEVKKRREWDNKFGTFEGRRQNLWGSPDLGNNIADYDVITGKMKKRR